ncbi:MAG: hypothetical protein OMOMHJEC_00805 [Xanthomonadales bacterium]|nr:hypothetical protein [Xanthomonadales bacterium]
MGDQSRMRVRDRRAHRQQQAHAPCLRQLRDRLLPAAPLDVLLDQPGLALGVDAGVEQARDAGVVQAGEDAALGRQPRRGPFGRDPGRQQLDRDLALELAVAALAQPDLAHAAASEPPQHAIGPIGAADQLPARQFGFGIVHRACTQGIEMGHGRRIRGDQRARLREQWRIVVEGLGEHRIAPLRRRLPGRLDGRPQARVVAHRGAPVSCRYNQVRAKA